MKKQVQKMIIGCLLSVPMITNAQFNQPFFIYGRTNAPIQKIGIGNFSTNASVQAKLHINEFLLGNNAATNGLLFRTDGNSNVANSWQMFTGVSANSTTEKFRVSVPANSNDAILQTSQNGAMRFNTNSVQRMTILANGNVGIGVTNPDMPLHIMGNGIGTFPNGWARGIHIQNHAVIAWDNDAVPGGSFVYMGHPDFGAEHSFYCALVLNQLPATPTNYSFRVVDIPTIGITSPQQGDVEFFHSVTANGNMAVGLNTSLNTVYNPTNRMEINTTATTGGTAPTVNSPNGNSGALVPNAGGGTGFSGLRFTDLRSTSTPVTTNPGAGVLSVDANGDVIYVKASSSGGGGGGGGGGTVTADNGLTIFPSGSNNVQLGGTLIKNTTIDQNNFDMSFINTGKVSIGSAGNSKFTVKNDASWAHISELYSSSGTNRMLIDENGNTKFSVDVLPGNAYGSRAMIIEAKVSVPNGWNQNLDVITDIQPGTAGGSAGVIGVSSTLIGDNVNGQNIAFNASPRNTLGDNVGYDAIINTSTTGDNYGAKFWVSSGQTAYGIWARADNASVNNYAGYFDGLVHVNGNIEANGFIPNPSDIQFKTDTASIQANTADSLLQLLQPKTFYFDTTNSYGMNFSSKKQFGLIAQEVESILPDLIGSATKTAVVDTAGNVVSQAVTYKTLTYTELIPLLIAGHKAQDAKMNALTSSNSALQNQNDSLENVVSDLNNRLSQLENCLSNLLPLLYQINQSALQQNSQETQRQLSQVINVTLTNDENIVLNQNVPNPFAESTVITYSIPASVQKAQLLFYDGYGKLMKTVDINERGAGRVNVFGSDLSSGRYSYTLVADGNVVATKFMVKTQD